MVCPLCSLFEGPATNLKLKLANGANLKSGYSPPGLAFNIDRCFHCPTLKIALSKPSCKQQPPDTKQRVWRKKLQLFNSCFWKTQASRENASRSQIFRDSIAPRLCSVRSGAIAAGTLANTAGKTQKHKHSTCSFKHQGKHPRKR